jgi:hypothetical protein
MTDENFSKRLNEKLQPEVDRIMADHERFMQAASKMPEPTEDQRRAIAEANSPEGWERALNDVLRESQNPQRRVLLWSVAFWIGLVALTCITLGALQLISN